MEKHRGLRMKANMNLKKCFKCDLCDAGIATKFNLRDHMNCVHLGKKRESYFYKPLYFKCGFFMIDRNSWKRHARVCADFSVAKNRSK
jgi:uncharacterized Zn-finger protein